MYQRTDEIYFKNVNRLGKNKRLNTIYQAKRYGCLFQ